MNNPAKISRPIEALIPAHQRSFSGKVTTTDELDANARVVKFDGIESGKTSCGK